MQKYQRKINGQSDKSGRLVRVEWEEKKFWISLINLCDMLSWYERLVNKTNNCMERRKGPSVLLGQVLAKTKFKRGIGDFRMSYVND